MQVHNHNLNDHFPVFDQPVVDDGYIWWYVDAISDDGQEALTIIAMLGNVFSPYYARARRKGPSDPMNYCAMNVVLYRPNGKRWAMTERPKESVIREAYNLHIGPSAMHWYGDHLRVVINETTVPLPSRLQGEVLIYPNKLTGHKEQLDGKGRHWWYPLAPCSRAEIKMTHPELTWKGHAYLDCNRGEAPLEHDFKYWDWSRISYSDHTDIIYDATRRDETRSTIALKITNENKVTTIDPGDYAPLPMTGWRVKRGTHSEQGTAQVIKTLEDTPFYSRSLLQTTMEGKQTTAMHESLDLDRFDSRWVQLLLPFRMPRRKAKTS